MDETRAFRFAGPPDRLDRFLTRSLESLSRTRVQRLIDEGRVTVDGKTAPSRRRLEPGETVAVSLPAFSSLPPAAADTVSVLYEDAEILVVDKAAGLVVHPAGPHRRDTLVQRLWPKLAPAWEGLRAPASDRPGVVHRLDRGTSGVMVLAKTPAAARDLSRQFAERRVRKTYWALVDGMPSAPSGEIRSMVGRSRRAPHRMTTEVPGRWSETDFTVLERFPDQGDRGRALLEVRPRTGRTHQIRVQLAALGHPLVGDATYGGPAGERPLLHAKELRFAHPRTGRDLVFEAPLPADMPTFRSPAGGRPPPTARRPVPPNPKVPPATAAGRPRRRFSV